MISAIVLTKNEENNIKSCLNGLKFCDEVIVVDDNSTDDTLKIAKKEGSRVYKRNLNNDFSGQRNYALSLASYDWILFVDADEIVSPELAKEISTRLKKNGNVNGFYFKRRDIFLGKELKYGETGFLRIIRLAKRGSGEWKSSVDELWDVKGNIETFKNPLLHNSHPDLTQFLNTINERSTLNARRFYQEGVRISLKEWLKPFFKFIDNFIFKLGFLDGTAGFVFAILMSLHSFLVRGKLYLIWKREGGWH